LRASQKNDEQAESGFSGGCVAPGAPFWRVRAPRRGTACTWSGRN